MIGSHNSFTHLPSTSSFMNSCSFLWRCQEKTIVEQYNAGVRYFDIRVKGTSVRGRNAWRVAHGNADLQKVFISIESIYSYFKDTMPGSVFRIVLEDNRTHDYFVQEVNKVIELQAKETAEPILVFAAVKEGWEVIYNAPNHPNIHDYSYVPWHSGWGFWENIKNFKPSTIKKWAKSHNPVITADMLSSKTDVYFMDYV